MPASYGETRSATATNKIERVTSSARLMATAARVVSSGSSDLSYIEIPRDCRRRAAPDPRRRGQGAAQGVASHSIGGPVPGLRWQVFHLVCIPRLGETLSQQASKRFEARCARYWSSALQFCDLAPKGAGSNFHFWGFRAPPLVLSNVTSRGKGTRSDPDDGGSR